jgi:hypothetical protein
MADPLNSFRVSAGGCALVLAWSCACTTVEQPDAQPGLNARECQALAETFYWQPNSGYPSYTAEQLNALLSRSADTSLDGERGEKQASDVALALASVGDDTFVTALEGQPASVRHGVARSGVPCLWTHYHLRYPKTQALLEPYESRPSRQ